MTSFRAPRRRTFAGLLAAGISSACGGGDFPMAQPCTLDIRPVDLEGAPLALDWATDFIWAPLYSPSHSAGWLVTDDCRELLCSVDKCVRPGSECDCSGLIGTHVGVEGVPAGVFESVQWFASVKVTGYRSAITPLVACSERYGSACLVLDVALSPIGVGEGELCRERAAGGSLWPDTQNCGVTLDVVDPAGDVLPATQVLLDDESGAYILSNQVPAPLTARWTDGLDFYGSVLVSSPGYTPLWTCVPCSTDSTLVLQPLPALGEIPPPGGW